VSTAGVGGWGVGGWRAEELECNEDAASIDPCVIPHSGTPWVIRIPHLPCATPLRRGTALGRGTHQDAFK